MDLLTPLGDSHRGSSHCRQERQIYRYATTMTTLPPRPLVIDAEQLQILRDAEQLLSQWLVDNVEDVFDEGAEVDSARTLLQEVLDALQEQLEKIILPEGESKV